jgi:hypothetical protein
MKMVDVLEKADVYLWDTKIGSIIWQNELGYFEYDQHFQRSNIQLSPTKMTILRTFRF